MSKQQPQQKGVDLAALSLEQLKQIKDQFEDEMQHLGGSYQQLKLVQNRYNDCIESLKEISNASADSEMLIPLTSSLYIPGKLVDIEKVIVDIGTGYYAEKSVEDAQGLYQRKVSYLKGNLEKLQENMMGRQNNLKLIVQFMQHKMNTEVQARQQQQQQV